MGVVEAAIGWPLRLDALTPNTQVEVTHEPELEPKSDA